MSNNQIKLENKVQQEVQKLKENFEKGSAHSE